MFIKKNQKHVTNIFKPFLTVILFRRQKEKQKAEIITRTFEVKVRAKVIT